MKAKAKVDIIDVYRIPKKTFVPMNAGERKEYKRTHAKCEESDLFNVVLIPKFFCIKGDELTIISQNPGAWMKVVIVENKQKQRLYANWDDLIAEDERK